MRVNPAFLTPFLGIVYLTGLVAFVAAVTVAILRYRLYDVDLVISRALVYGALGVCITTTYVAVVAGVGTLAGTRGEPGSNLVLSLVATALVAVIFQPARQRLQRLANRLVYGQRASPYEVLADFSERIAGALSVDEVLPRMAEAAAHGVGATRSRVRVYVPGGQDRAVAWPADALAGPFERTVPVSHQGTPVGEIAVSKPERESLTAAEDKLLADLAAQAGPAFKNVRLDLELQARLEELQASRQRIVAAQDAERRRLERDLHDGAQQHLVALAVNLRLAHELVEQDPAGRRAAGRPHRPGRTGAGHAARPRPGRLPTRPGRPRPGGGGRSAHRQDVPRDPARNGRLGAEPLRPRGGGGRLLLLPGGPAESRQARPGGAWTRRPGRRGRVAHLRRVGRGSRLRPVDGQYGVGTAEHGRSHGRVGRRARRARLRPVAAQSCRAECPHARGGQLLSLSYSGPERSQPRCQADSRQCSGRGDVMRAVLTSAPTSARPGSRSGGGSTGGGSSSLGDRCVWAAPGSSVMGRP